MLPQDHATSKDTGRNRQETRTIAVFDPANAITDPDWHACISSIIRVERQVHTRNAKTGLWDLATHTACYLANRPMTASRAADAIRAHWTIENTSHYSRDVTMGGVAQGSSRDSGWNSNGGEDASRIRSNPGVFARLRSFAYNILKANPTGTLPQDRYRAALGGIKPLLKIASRIER